MADQPTTFDDHDPLAHNILQVLEEFIDEIGVRECTAHFDKVIDGQYFLKGKHLIQKPERFTEDHLVFPMLRQAFGYSLRPQPKQYAPVGREVVFLTSASTLSRLTQRCRTISGSSAR